MQGKRKKSSSVSAKSALDQLLSNGAEIVFQDKPQRMQQGNGFDNALAQVFERALDNNRLPSNEALFTLPLDKNYKPVLIQFAEHADPHGARFPKASLEGKSIYVRFPKKSGQMTEPFPVPIKGMLMTGAVREIEKQTGLTLTRQN